MQNHMIKSMVKSKVNSLPAKILRGALAIALIISLSLALDMSSISPNIQFVSAAQAQEAKPKRKSFFQRLFGKRKKKEKAKAPAKRSGNRIAQKPKVPVVEKLENAQTILVVGDFIASGLANGLVEAYAKNPNVKVVKKTKGSSGLVRLDAYDWIENIGPMVDEIDPKLIVFTIGSNDRQDMVVDGEIQKFGSEGWKKGYRDRVSRMITSMSIKNRPFLWVGTPSFKFSKMTTEMLGFNAIYQDELEKAGRDFVDIWEGFVNEDGNFIYTGSDINGQQVRLRTSDGLNFTRAGQRKLAFYVEKPAARFLGQDGFQFNLNDTFIGAGIDAKPVDPRLVTQTRPYLLSDPALDGDSELLGGNTKQIAYDEQSPLDKLIETGEMPSAPLGRVDNFAWGATPQDTKEAVQDTPVQDLSTTSSVIKTTTAETQNIEIDAQ